MNTERMELPIYGCSNRERLGGWEFNIGEKRIMPEATTAFLGEYLTSNLSAFNRENPRTYAERVLGIPTCLVRIDASFQSIMEKDQTKIIKGIYEIEARPAGLGVFLLVASRNQEEGIKNLLRRVFAQFENFGGFKVCSSAAERAEDTRKAADILGFPYYGPSDYPYGDCLLWVRGSEEDEDGKKLEGRPLCPVSDHGDKNYLLKLGLARRVEGFENIPWEISFVAKPLKGSKMNGVVIYVPACDQKKLFRNKPPQGISTRSQVERELASGKEYIYQEFVCPLIEMEEGKRKFVIARLYFGWNLRQNRYEFIGGLWNSRSTLRVHGASDATFGLLISK